jgi:hypothetical protein
MMTKPPAGSAARTRDWRARRRQHPGGLTQVITWVPSEYAAQLRKIFALLGDPDWRGIAYRSVVAPWLHRRRPGMFRGAGDGYAIEIDAPEIDKGRELIPIGGRIFGADRSFVELNPVEADELNKNLQAAIAGVARDFLARHGLEKHVRDRTGVLLPDIAPHHAGYRPPDMEVYDVDRPENEQQYVVREATVVAETCGSQEPIAIDTVSEGIYELRYLGGGGMPSRALLVIGIKGDHGRTIDDQSSLITLIGLPGGGTPPTLVFADLVKTVREKFLAGHDAPLRYLDVEPNEFSPSAALRMSEVKPGDGDFSTLQWLPNPKISLGLNYGLRAALEDYRAWRRRGRLSEADVEALGSLGDGGGGS